MKAGVVAFAFGAPSTIRSNRMIAKIALQKARERNAPIFTQLDVHIYGANRAMEDDNNPPTILRIAREAIQWAKERGLEELWIVAAKPHLWRAFRDMREALREAGGEIKIHACREIDECSGDLWFCISSTQAWTRSKGAWDRREKILKSLPLFLYKIIAR